MGDSGYGKDIAYLQHIVDNGGTVGRDNRIFQKLDDKRNIGSVASFLDSIADKMHG